MKKWGTYRIVILFSILFSGTPTTIASEPDSIITYKNRLSDATGKERMRVLRTLARFYLDSLPEAAIGYNAQYLKLSELDSSVQDMAQANQIFASIYRYQLDYRKSLKYNQEALKLFRMTADSFRMAIEYFRISDNYSFLNRFDSAVIYNDSGYRHVENKNTPYQLFRAKIQLGKALSLHDDNIKAIGEFNQALQIASNLDDPRMLGWILYWLGFTQMKLGEFGAAEQNLRASIAYYDTVKLFAGVIGSQQALGELYLKTRDFAGAYDCFFKAWEKHEYVKGDLGALNYVVQYYVNMGEIYFNVSEYDDAIQFYDSACNLAKTLGLAKKIALVNMKTGRLYFRQGDLEQALDYYSNSLEYFSSRNNRYPLADLLNKIGGVYEARGEIEQAVNFYHEAIDINKEIGNNFGLAQNHINLASSFKSVGSLPAMKQELDEGLKYARLTEVDQLLLRYYNYYITYYEQTGQHQKAHGYFETYIPLSRQINQNNRQNISKMLVELYTNELDRERQLLNQQLELTRLEAKSNQMNNRQLILFASLIFVILLLIGYFLVNRIRMTRKLERQVEERTHALVENEKKLIEISQTKDQFYSIIAHDLKSPFNSLIGFSNLLHDDYDDFSDEERKQFITIVRNSSEEIFALLENLLDWTRKSSDNISFKPARIDLQRLIKQTIQLQEKNALMKQITIKNHIPKNTFVAADENMLRTVVRNLASNAIKFTNPEGTITFKATVNNGFVECSVNDDGIGMNENTLNQLFNLSGKIKKKGTANEKGTGLGLLLCKDFVERHGGKLTVESRENQGSKFTFSLPAK